MNTCNLEEVLKATREDVRSCSKTYKQIGDETGLSESWVAKFAQGKINNPGIANLMRLRDYLQQAA